MGGLIGQTPWTMLNQLTERNLEMWKEFQQNLVGGIGRPAAEPARASRAQATPGQASRRPDREHEPAALTPALAA